MLNAANEIAVAAFLEGQIKFLDIPRIVESALDQHAARSCFGTSPRIVDDILATDEAARATAHEHIVSL